MIKKEQRTLQIDLPIRDIGFNTFEMKVVRGPDKGKSRFFKKRNVIVGTDKSADLVLSDPTVSHRHFSIAFDGVGLKIKDLDSRNGTIIGNLRVLEAYLTENSIITAGDTRIRLLFRKERVKIPVVEGFRFGNMVGRSFLMREVFARMKRAADSDITVLLVGESGTGKELAASALHELGGRRDRPFVVFDSTAVAKELAESELFGHVRGAFTGATSDRTGAVRKADKGTLFLDEIGDLPMELQSMLLRLIEHREVKPVGTDRYIKVDTRIIAATNRNLKEMVQKGTFREDLYFRLAVLQIEMPPLRNRMEDLPLIVDSLLEEISQRYKTPVSKLSKEDLDLLGTYSWPGNIRELKNHLEAMVIMGEQLFKPNQNNAFSQAGNGGFQSLESLPYRRAKETLIRSFDEYYFTRLLEKTNGNITKAAEIAGVHRKTVEYILKKQEK